MKVQLDRTLKFHSTSLSGRTSRAESAEARSDLRVWQRGVGFEAELAAPPTLSFCDLQSVAS